MSTMKVTAIMEMGPDGLFSCSVANDENLHTGIAGYGKSANEAKEDMLQCYREMNEILVEEGKEPLDLDFDFKIDIQSFFSIFPFFNISRIADMAGINQSLLRQYASGISQPSDKQYVRLSNAINRIKQDLSKISF